MARMVERAPDWLASKIGDELVMMNVKTGRYIALTEVGTRIWELIETPIEVDAIVGTLEAEYEVAPETCRAEVEAFLEDLARNKAVKM